MDMHDLVELIVALPEHGLVIGDLGAIVEVLDPSTDQGYMVEFGEGELCLPLTEDQISAVA